MSLDREKAITVLNRILGLELAGVVRYTHYALMVYCYRFIIVPKVAVDTATLSTAPQSPRSSDPHCFSTRRRGFSRPVSSVSRTLGGRQCRDDA